MTEHYIKLWHVLPQNISSFLINLFLHISFMDFIQCMMQEVYVTTFPIVLC